MSRVTTAMHRVMEVDALRGLALLGILMVNVWFFADSSTLSGARDPAAAHQDIAIRFAVATLFEGKFYLLFSLLFGYGIAVTTDAPGEDGVRLTLRRLAFLAVLGILHGLTLFYGDILLTYALAGTILLATRTITPRAALGLAVAITAGVAVLFAATGVLLLLGDTGGTDSPVGVRVLSAASPAGAFAANAGIYGEVLPSVVLGQGPLALAAAYAGYALAKLGVLRPAVPSPAVLRRVVVLTLPLGLPLSAGQAYLGLRGGDGPDLLAAALSVVASPLVTAGYAASLLLLLGTRAGRSVAAVLAAAGRLSLTNYLAQSAVLSVVFTGYGFGLLDRLPAPAVVLLVVVLFAVQAAASRLVLTRYRTGPLEWALRRFVRPVPSRRFRRGG